MGPWGRRAAFPAAGPGGATVTRCSGGLAAALALAGFGRANSQGIKKKSSFWRREAHRFASSEEEKSHPVTPLRGTRCLGASLVFIPTPGLQPCPSPPPAAAQRDKIKAIPAPGDLLPGNNWVLFGRNVAQPGPGDGKSTGLVGTGLRRLSRGSVGIKGGFMKGQLTKNNAMDEGKAPEQVFYMFSFHSRNCT